ncbi:hypothetical protein Tco_1486510 [Tanacetum coccineum]
MQKTSTQPLQTKDEPLDQKSSGHVANLRPDLSGSQTGTRDRCVFNNDRPIVWAPPEFDTVILSLTGHTRMKDEERDGNSQCKLIRKVDVDGRSNLVQGSLWATIQAENTLGCNANIGEDHHEGNKGANTI